MDGSGGLLGLPGPAATPTVETPEFLEVFGKDPPVAAVLRRRQRAAPDLPADDRPRETKRFCCFCDRH